MGLGEMPDYTETLRDPRVSVIAGALDSKYVAIARELGVPLVEIADSGHDPTLEQPLALAAQLSNLARS
jgi:pimeloyl-ACP methyl ester carboxylesterase